MIKNKLSWTIGAVATWIGLQITTESPHAGVQWITAVVLIAYSVVVGLASILPEENLEEFRSNGKRAVPWGVELSNTLAVALYLYLCGWEWTAGFMAWSGLAYEICQGTFGVDKGTKKSC